MKQSTNHSFVTKAEEVFHNESAKFNLSSQFYRETPRYNFTFVNLTPSSEAKQDSRERKLVRSHVMHNVHQQKQLQEDEDWQAQRVILPSDIPLVVSERLVLNPARIEASTQQDATKPHFGAFYEDHHWNTTANPAHYQSIDVSMTPETQGSWVSSTWIPNHKTCTPIESMVSEPGGSNIGNTPASRNSYRQDGNIVRLFTEITDPNPMIPSSQSRTYPSVSQGFQLSLLGRGRLDPFDIMPSLLTGRAHALMCHYNQILVRSMLSVAVDPDDKWFRYAITDSALFHSTMLHSAAHHAMLTGNTDLVELASLKLEAIKLVNGRLCDPVLGLSDVTIGAVVALVLFENQSANVEFSNIHMKGLSQMVHLRGGLHNLGLAGILRRKILWADLCNSMYSHSKPYFDNLISLKSGSKEEDIASTGAPIGDYNAQLLGIFFSLRSLSFALSGPFSRTNIAVDNIYSVERRVVLLLAETNSAAHLSLMQSDKQSALLQHVRRIYQILLAVEIYIYLFLRDTLVRSPIFSILVSRLSCSFNSSDTGSNLKVTLQEIQSNDTKENGGENEILFWVLVLAALAADGREDRNRFRTDLKGICNVLRIHTFTEFVDKLMKTAWIEKKVDYTLLKLWNEIQSFE